MHVRNVLSINVLQELVVLNTFLFLNVIFRAVIFQSWKFLHTVIRKQLRIEISQKRMVIFLDMHINYYFVNNAERLSC